LEKAAQVYQERIASYPHDDRAYLDLGAVYGALGEYERAAETTRQALRLAPDVGPYNNLCNYLLSLQRFDEARQMIQHAQAQNLDDALIHSQLYALVFLAGNSLAMQQQLAWFRDKPKKLGDFRSNPIPKRMWVGCARHVNLQVERWTLPCALIAVKSEQYRWTIRLCVRPPSAMRLRRGKLLAKL